MAEWRYTVGKQYGSTAVKSIVRVCVTVMLIVVLLAEGYTTAYARNGGALWDTYGDTRLEIDRRDWDVNQPFVAANLFPGDKVSEDYEVDVCHKGSVLLHFRAVVRPGYEKLGEVLKLCVQAEGKTLYDGLMTQMPESIGYLVVPDKTRTVVSKVDYRLTAYLDTSVGNEYQNQDLIADFQWWVLVDEQSGGDDSGGGSGGDDSGGGSGSGSHGDSYGTVDGSGSGNEPDGYLMVLPRTGDIIGWIVGAAVVSGLMFLIVCFFGKKRKEEEDGA